MLVSPPQLAYREFVRTYKMLMEIYRIYAELINTYRRRIDACFILEGSARIAERSISIWATNYWIANYPMIANGYNTFVSNSDIGGSISYKSSDENDDINLKKTDKKGHIVHAIKKFVRYIQKLRPLTMVEIIETMAEVMGNDDIDIEGIVEAIAEIAEETS